MIERRLRDIQEAIGKAHELFETGIFKSVKVVKEVFDPQSDLGGETIVVYRLP